MRRVLSALVAAVIGGIVAVSVAARVTDGPLTPWGSERGVTDENGYVRLSAAAPGLTDGPLTLFPNLRVRTDENGYLRVSLASGSIVVPATTCTNQFITAIATTGAGTCTTATLASAQFANQGTTTTLLHGNASGNPTFGAASLTADVSGTLPFANGGFGFATATLGDLFYASATNTPGKLSDVATGSVLKSGGVGAAPSWGTIASSFLSDGSNIALLNASNTFSNGTNAFDGTIDGNQILMLRNSSTGTSAVAELRVTNSVGVANMRLSAFGTGFTTAGTTGLADSFRILSDGANGLTLAATNSGAGGIIRLTSKGTTIDATLTAGVWDVLTSYSVGGAAGQTATCTSITSLTFTGGILTGHTCTSPEALFQAQIAPFVQPMIDAAVAQALTKGRP